MSGTEEELVGERKTKEKGSSASYPRRRAVWVDLEKCERAQDCDALFAVLVVLDKLRNVVCGNGERERLGRRNKQVDKDSAGRFGEG